MFDRKLFNEIFEKRLGWTLSDEMLDIVEGVRNEAYIQGFERGEQAGYDKAVEDFNADGSDESLND